MKSKILTLLIIISIKFCYSQTVNVKRVIDGDTFVIENNERVRMIGINAPEISDIHGVEAKEHLQSLIENKQINIVSDKISNDRDRYSRLLRYVYINDTDINKKMIEDGFAIAYLKFKFEKANEYSDAQLFAEAKGNNGKNKPKEENHYSTSDFNIKRIVVFGLIGCLVVLGIFYSFRR